MSNRKPIETIPSKLHVSLHAMALANFNPFVDDPWVMNIYPVCDGVVKVNSVITLTEKTEWVRREPFKATSILR